MKIGISRPPTPPLPLADIDGALVARHAEEFGFESVFYGEHTIHPVGEEGFGPHAHGVPFFQDTLVMMARASAMTSKITIASGVLLIPQHHPVQLAKHLASLDLYSSGRVLVGASVGWSRVECELLGGNFDRRWAQTGEAIKIMKRLWHDEVAEYDGEFFKVPPVKLFPKAHTLSGPPVLLGAGAQLGKGLTPLSCSRIIEYADGWLPVFLSEETIRTGPETVRQGRRQLAEEAQRVGRDPATIQVTVMVRGNQVDGDITKPTMVSRDILREFEDAGADRAVISLPTICSEQDAKDALSQIAEAVL